MSLSDPLGNILASEDYSGGLGTWRSDAQPGATVAVVSGKLVLTPPSGAFAQGAIAYWSGQPAVVDGEYRFEMTVDTNGSYSPVIALRSDGGRASNERPWRGYCVVLSRGSSSMTLRRRDGGNPEVILASASFTPPAANVPMTGRFRAMGGRLSYKFWPTAEGEPEPWQLDATDPNPILVAGKAHVFALNGNDSTVRPVRFDNWVLGDGQGSVDTEPAPTVNIAGGTRTVNAFEDFTITATSNQTSVAWATTGPALPLVADNGLSRTYRGPGLYAGALSTVTVTATNADGETATASVQVNTRPHSEFADSANTKPVRIAATSALLPGEIADVPSQPAFTLETTKPTTANTGPRYSLTQTIAGDFTPTSGTTYERVKFTGRILTNSSMTGVVFRDCYFAGLGTRTSDSALVNNELATSEVKYEFCLFKPDSPSQYWHGIRGKNYTLTRCRFEGVVDGWNVNVGGTVNVKVHGCYIADLAYFSPCSYQSDNRTHNDSGFIFGGSNIEVLGNVLSANASATIGDGGSTTVPAPNPYHPSVTGQALGVNPSAAVNSPPANVTVRGNWFTFGAQSITIIPGAVGVGSGWSITDNRFDTRTNPTIGGAKRAVFIDPAVTIPGIPASTGPDQSSGNTDWDGSPVVIYRSLSGGAYAGAATFPVTFPMTLA